LKYGYDPSQFGAYGNVSTEGSKQAYAYEVGSVAQLIPDAPPYEVVARRHGAFGAVYIVRSAATGNLSAFKSPRYDRQLDQRYFEDFAREGIAWVNLPRHMSIVPAHRVVRHNGRPLIHMDYLPPVTTSGASLMDVLVDMPDDQMIHPQMITSLVGQLIGVLKHVADSDGSFSHGDIKPSNLMLRIDGNQLFSRASVDAVVLCLSDFGMAIGERTLQYSSTVAGDLCYLPPETLISKGVSDSYTNTRIARDIYAIGCTLFELATRMRWQMPGAQGVDIVTQVDLGFKFTDFLRRRPDLGPVAELLPRCLDRNPQERPASFHDLFALWGEIGERYKFVFREKTRHPDRINSSEITSVAEEPGLTDFLIAKGWDPGAADEVVSDLLLASNYRNLNKIARANEILNRILALIPGFAPAVAAVAHGQMLVRNTAGAIHLYLQAMRSYDSDHELREHDRLGYGSMCANLAQMLAFETSDRNLLAGAVHWGRLGVRLLPHESRSYLALGLALMRSGDPVEALEVLAVGSGKDPSNATIKNFILVAGIIADSSLTQTPQFRALPASEASAALETAAKLSAPLTD